MASKQVRPGRTLMVFFIGVAIAYGLVALNGSWKPSLGSRPAGRHPDPADRQRRPHRGEPRRGAQHHRPTGQRPRCRRGRGDHAGRQPDRRGGPGRECGRAGGGRQAPGTAAVPAGRVQRLLPLSAPARTTPQNPLDSPSAEPTAELPEAAAEPNNGPRSASTAPPTRRAIPPTSRSRTRRRPVTPRPPSPHRARAHRWTTSPVSTTRSSPLRSTRSSRGRSHPTRPRSQLFDQFTCADDGTLQKADGTAADGRPRRAGDHPDGRRPQQAAGRLRAGREQPGHRLRPSGDEVPVVAFGDQRLRPRLRECRRPAERGQLGGQPRGRRRGPGRLHRPSRGRWSAPSGSSRSSSTARSSPRRPWTA